MEIFYFGFLLFTCLIFHVVFDDLIIFCVCVHHYCTKFYHPSLVNSVEIHFFFCCCFVFINNSISHNLLCADDGGGGGGGGGLIDESGPSASLYVIMGHFKFVPLGDAIEFDAKHSGVHDGDALEFESVRLCFDELRLRPNFRKENRGRKLNVELSHSALKLIPFAVLVVASFESVFDVDTIRLFVLCFRLFFFDELVLLMLLIPLSPVSMVAIESLASQKGRKLFLLLNIMCVCVCAVFIYYPLSLFDRISFSKINCARIHSALN